MLLEPCLVLPKALLLKLFRWVGCQVVVGYCSDGPGQTYCSQYLLVCWPAPLVILEAPLQEVSCLLPPWVVLTVRWRLQAATTETVFDVGSLYVARVKFR